MRGGVVQQPTQQPTPPRPNRRYEGPLPNRKSRYWGRRVEELEFTNLPIPRMPFPKFGGGTQDLDCAMCRLLHAVSGS
jgi:hypothetical protein